eukprot:980909-Pyramimonas_sp.AAC.1
MAAKLDLAPQLSLRTDGIQSPLNMSPSHILIARVIPGTGPRDSACGVCLKRAISHHPAYHACAWHGATLTVALRACALVRTGEYECPDHKELYTGGDDDNIMMRHTWDRVSQVVRAESPRNPPGDKTRSASEAVQTMSLSVYSHLTQ